MDTGGALEYRDFKIEDLDMDPATKHTRLARPPPATDGLLGGHALPVTGDQLRQAVTPPRSPDPDPAERLKVLDEAHVKGCTKCGLRATRTTPVFGRGSADARLVFVGEAPGYDEDQQGLAFVGKAGSPGAVARGVAGRCEAVATGVAVWRGNAVGVGNTDGGVAVGSRGGGADAASAGWRRA